MHISEGVLSVPVLMTGAALTAIGTTIGLKRLDYEHIAQVGILAALFFVASLIHVPIGPSSVHLLLNGIVGLLLGWAAFPALLTGLTLQAVFLQFGGITVLGVNSFNLAGPAVLCGFLFRSIVINQTKYALMAAFACGALSVFFTSLMVAISLIWTEESFFQIAALVISAHIPVMIIEGLITMFCIAFLKKVQPAALSVFHQ